MLKKYSKELEAYDKGYNKGYQDGYDKGRNDGLYDSIDVTDDDDYMFNDDGYEL